ncbi:hypothetical protein JXB28_02425 [Candidatus Woesearchaeota archaeon]|nr:hypothetical protein [Candidatus Woesearchaeota archaeon]
MQKKQEQQELSPRQKQLNEAMNKVMAEVQRQEAGKNAKGAYMPANPSAAYDGKSLTLSKKGEFKAEDGLVTKLGADFVVDESRRAKAFNFTGEHVTGSQEKVSAFFSYDLQSRQSMLQGSYRHKDKGLEVAVRNFKEPVFKAYAPIAKGMSIGVHADPARHYYATNLGFKHQGLNAGIRQESIFSNYRTTTSLSYSLPEKYDLLFKSLSWTHVMYNGSHRDSFQANAKIGFANVQLGLDNMARPEKYNPCFRIMVNKKF